MASTARAGGRSKPPTLRRADRTANRKLLLRGAPTARGPRPKATDAVLSALRPITQKPVERKEFFLEGGFDGCEGGAIQTIARAQCSVWVAEET